MIPRHYDVMTKIIEKYIQKTMHRYFYPWSWWVLWECIVEKKYHSFSLCMNGLQWIWKTCLFLSHKTLKNMFRHTLLLPISYFIYFIIYTLIILFYFLQVLCMDPSPLSLAFRLSSLVQVAVSLGLSLCGLPCGTCIQNSLFLLLFL